MKIKIIFLVLFIFCLGGFAQNPDRIYESHREENGQFFVKTNHGTYTFTFYSTRILEATFVPKDEIYNEASHAVVMAPENVETAYSYIGNAITYQSSDLALVVTTDPFQISYFYKNQPVVSEKRGYYKSPHTPMDLVKGNIVTDSTEKIEFNITKNEILYGAGSRALGMNRRGYRLPLYNRAHYGYETHSELMNFTLPIVLSSNQYLLHFDNAPIGYLDLDSEQNNTLIYETISGRKTYQVIVGDDWYELLDSYTTLTGKQPMLPRWALGNFSSRFGYHSQQETETTITSFKDDNIPVDAIILDLYWFGKEVKGTMGNLEVFRDSFPDFEGMIERLQSKKVKTITITEPFVLTTSKRWDEAVQRGILAKDSLGKPATYDFYFGNTGIIDIYKPEGKQWFWNIYKTLIDKGVSGIWGDLGEPEVLPSWVNFEAGSADEIHNIYGHDWAGLVYNGYQQDYPNTRPFILMRAGYSGSQRYGMLPWSGDVNRTWGGLQSQPSIALQMGMQGLGYMHSDLGGFAGANLDDELYVRWLQYGVFNPIFRPHAQEDVPSEPVFRSEKAKALAKYAIQMRYRLLPYNYHLVYENHKEGKPLMRALFFEEPSNSDLLDYSETYLWGNDLLVSPVLKDSISQQEVYFPKGSKWFDIETDAIIEGGQKKQISLNEAFIPVYVRAGAFIPLAKSMTSIEDYDDTVIQLQYYHHKDVKQSKRALYMDDGKTAHPLEKEMYQILHFESKFSGSWLTIDFKSEIEKNYSQQTKSIELTIHNVKSKPKRVKVNSKKTKSTYNSKYKTITLHFEWNTETSNKVEIKL